MHARLSSVHVQLCFQIFFIHYIYLFLAGVAPTNSNEAYLYFGLYQSVCQTDVHQILTIILRTFGVHMFLKERLRDFSFDS